MLDISGVINQHVTFTHNEEIIYGLILGGFLTDYGITYLVQDLVNDILRSLREKEYVITMHGKIQSSEFDRGVALQKKEAAA